MMTIMNNSSPLQLLLLFYLIFISIISNKTIVAATNSKIKNAISIATTTTTATASTPIAATFVTATTATQSLSNTRNKKSESHTANQRVFNTIQIFTIHHRVNLHSRNLEQPPIVVIKSRDSTPYPGPDDHRNNNNNPIGDDIKPNTKDKGSHDAIVNFTTPNSNKSKNTTTAKNNNNNNNNNNNDSNTNTNTKSKNNRVNSINNDTNTNLPSSKNNQTQKNSSDPQSTPPRIIIISLCIAVSSLIGCFLCILGTFKITKFYCFERFVHRKPTLVGLVSLKRQSLQLRQSSLSSQQYQTMSSSSSSSSQKHQPQQHDHYLSKNPRSISGKMISLPKPLLQPLDSQTSISLKSSKELLRIKTDPHSPTALHITSPLDTIPPRRPSHHDTSLSPCSPSSPYSTSSPSPSPSSATFPLLKQSNWTTDDTIDSLPPPLQLHHYENYYQPHLSPYPQQHSFPHHEPTPPLHVKPKRMPMTCQVPLSRANVHIQDGHHYSPKDLWSPRSIQTDLSSFPWERTARSNH